MAEVAPPPPKKMKKVKVPRVVNGIETEVEIEVEDAAATAWGEKSAHTLLNKSIPRVDGPLKVTGAAVYTADVRLPGMLYGRILRCPHPHARLKDLDLAPALALRGVKAAVAGPNKEFHYEGDSVAAVAAISPEIAEDALRAIKARYEVLPHVVRAERAVKPDAPRVLPAGNVEEKVKRGEPDKVAAALGACDAVVEADYKTPIIHHGCLETHGNVVDYRGGESATVYASTQAVFSIRGDSAKALGIPESGVVVKAEHMGGGFGSKFGIGIEGKLACELSVQAKAPVKLMLTRRDEFLMAGHRSASWQTLKGGVTKDGTLVALHAMQRRLGGVGEGSQAVQPYIYSVTNAYSEVVSVRTNECWSRAMRAPGHPQASWAMESLLDELAHKIGMDPLELRKKNLKDPVYHRQLDRGAQEIGWSRRNRVAGEAPGPKKRGIGCALAIWGGGGRPECVVTVAITRDGHVAVSVGTQDLGTGTRTYVRAIVAEELGLTMKDVVEHIGDSRLGAANGSGGSTTAASLAPAVKNAAVAARVKLAEAVAPLLKAEAGSVTFSNGSVSAGASTLSWKQACAALPTSGLSARGEWSLGLSETGVHGATFAEVEVDVETGRVRPIKMVHVQDGGLPLNRLLFESQLNGGMIQALGLALHEGSVNDADLGLRLNPGFGDYKIPGMLEMPELVPIIDDDDTRAAVIGIAEPATIPGAAAIANAVFNACGARVREAPITPDKVLMALLAKEGRG
jgi:xanthine dehydrogenase YagR molybdenum-binding subunit